MPQLRSNRKNMQLQQLMEKEKLTSKELAQRVGVSPEWFSKIANGHVEGYRIRLKICEIFKVPYESIWSSNASTARDEFLLGAEL